MQAGERWNGQVRHVFSFVVCIVPREGVQWRFSLLHGARYGLHCSSKHYLASRRGGHCKNLAHHQRSSASACWGTHSTGSPTVARSMK